MSKAQFNKFVLNDYPGYSCYLLDINGNYHPTQTHFDKNEVEIGWMWGWNRGQLGSGTMIPQSRASSLMPACADVSENDRLVFHEKCRIPRKLITKGIVINDKSVDVPTKLVVPDSYSYYINHRYYSYSQMVILVNEDIKTVFAVDAYVFNNESVGGTEQQWVDALCLAQDLYQDFSADDLKGFKMPFGTELFTIFFNMDDIDTAIVSGLLPRSIMVEESDIETGTEPLSLDILYSSYMMLQSPDDQIVETAFNMLAHSKFCNNKCLIKWLLKPYDSKARSYKSKSTAFAWLYKSSDCSRYSSTSILGYKNELLAKQLIERITKGDIHWDTEGSIVINNAKWLDDSHLRALVQAV